MWSRFTNMMKKLFLQKIILKICMDSTDTVCGLFLKKKQMN